MPSSATRSFAFLHDFPRWYFLAILAWAPWCYGSTRDWSARLLGAMMCLLGVFWLISLVIQQRRPLVPALLVAAVAILGVQGWWLIANADHSYDRAAFRFDPVQPLVAWLPGAADTVQAIPVMMRYTGVFVVFLFVADLVSRPVWRTRIWWALSATGLSLVTFGIVRKILGLHLVSAQTFEPGVTSFATYYYHANAGAFVNLVLPFIWMLAAMSWRRRQQLGLAIWVPALLLCVCASVVIASKAAMVFSGLIVLALLGIEFTLQKQRGGVSPKALLISGALTLAAVGAAVALGWSQAAGRWAQMAESPHLTGLRLIAYGICLKMLPDSGWWGFGPGNFSITFPHYTAEAGDKIRGYWAYAHQDYLQTLIEWGWFGGFFWGAILIGAIVTGISTLRRAQMAANDQAFLLAALLALLGVAAHSAVDFPLQVASLQLYAAVAIGILWGSPNIAATSRASVPDRWPGR